MNIPKIADVLGQIDDRHISQAADYRRIKHNKLWMKYGTAAAGVLILFAAIVLAFRGGNIPVAPAPGVTVNTIETDPTVTITTDPTVTTPPDEIGSTTSVSETYDTANGTEISDEAPPVGGGDATFMRRYIAEVDNIYIIGKIVGKEVEDDWVENVYLAKSPDEQDYLPAVYQAIHDLNIPKEDFVAENEKFSDYPGMYFSEEVIEALYLKDISEMKRRLVNPTALYYNGEIYTFDELSHDPQRGEAIPDDVLNEYLDFIESVCEQEKMLKYMQDEIDRLRR